MGVIEILEGLKDKVLDVAHVQVLESAYRLQEQNIEQLKNNNEALKESNALLQEKVKSIEMKNQQLNEIVANLPLEQTNDDISAVAKAILRKCIEDEASTFYDVEIIAKLSASCSRMEGEAGIGNLSKNGLIVQASTLFRGEGVQYRLTQEGKEYALSLS